MSLIDMMLGKKPASANIARDRLTVMLAVERSAHFFPQMEEMKQEILEVIKKYTKVKDIKIKSENKKNIEMLEVEIFLDKDSPIAKTI